jgi:hypothetical protein
VTNRPNTHYHSTTVLVSQYYLYYSVVVFPSRSSRTITILVTYIHLAYEPQDIYPYFSHGSFIIGSLFHETDHPLSISSTTLLSAPNHPPCCMPNVHSYIRVLQAKSIPSNLGNDFTKPTTNQPIGHSRAAETEPKSPDHVRRQRLSARIDTLQELAMRDAAEKHEQKATIQRTEK